MFFASGDVPILIHSQWFAVLVIAGSTVLAAVGLLLTRRFMDQKALKDSHDVGGYLLSVTGTLFAVLLGLVVVDAMQNYQRAREIVERESNCLTDVVILADRLPEPRRSKVRNMCADYADQVVSTEWNQMSCASDCPLSREKAISLMQALMDFEPRTENEKALYPQMVQEASQFWQNREARITIAKTGLPALEWAALIAGAVITVFFTFFFVVENVAMQLAMTVMVAFLVSLNLMLLLMFAYPFSGDTGLGNDAFASVQEILKTVEENNAAENAQKAKAKNGKTKKARR